MKTVETVAEVDASGWLSIRVPAPAGCSPGPVEALVVLQTRDGATTESAVDCLERIAQAGGLDIEDPVAWQREVRSERSLPNRT
jgi:hypothetical protein